MPLLPLLEAIANRIIVALVALFAVFGLGSIAESPTHFSQEPKPVIEAPQTIEETDSVPEEAPKDTEEFPDQTQGETPQQQPTENDPVQELEQTPTVEAPQPEIPAQTEEPEIPLSFSDINKETTKALVNVLCFQNVVGAVNPITGSGVIIDPRGIVITNAHVAQFFLVKDYPVKNSLECILRTGSPARATYSAELFYIPPTWVIEHAKDITNTSPVGTGENDYAFLRITGRTDPQAELPTTFPFIPIDIKDSKIDVGDSVLAAAYPAGFLGGISIQKDLYAVSSIATVREVFTFREGLSDLISIGGTVVSQGGSSGGAAVSKDGKLIGIIVTSTRETTTAERDLRATTLGHVNRSLLAYANTTIDLLLLGDTTLKAALFNATTVPSLTDLLIREIVN